jgi:hypothetical protein
MALHERGRVAALAVLLSLGGLSCGREATPEGLIARRLGHLEPHSRDGERLVS